MNHLGNSELNLINIFHKPWMLGYFNKLNTKLRTGSIQVFFLCERDLPFKSRIASIYMEFSTKFWKEQQYQKIVPNWFLALFV